MTTDYFSKQPRFNLRPWSLVLFVLAAIIAWTVNIVGQMNYPSLNLLPYFTRLIITLGTDIALVWLSFRLLQLHGLPKESLGLTISGKTIADLALGAVIAMLSITVSGLLLYLCVPFHFVPGTMAGTVLLQEGAAYFLGNTLEELIFRGFLFIILARLFGWRISVVVMALPFGLFHLQMTGFTTDGLRMIATTAAYSFVFSLSFVLTRSLWTAISVHAVSNILLHAVSGLDGANKAVYLPEFEKEWPKSYDAGLIVFIVNSMIISAVLYLFILSRYKKKANFRVD